MKTKIILISLLAGFVLLCGLLVVEAGLFKCSSSCSAGAIVALAGETTPDEVEGRTGDGEEIGYVPDSESGFDFSVLAAVPATLDTVTIGSLDADSGYKFELELTSKGAGVARATLSEFDDRDPDEPMPLTLLSPIIADDERFPLANRYFGVVGQKKRFPLHKLNWRIGETVSYGDMQKVVFETVLKDAGGKDAFKLVKTYRIQRGSYDIDCELAVENLSDITIKTSVELQGPCGLGREGVRDDMRKVIAAFFMPDGSIDSIKLENTKLRKAVKGRVTDNLQIRHKNPDAGFIWAAVTNKYFAAILRAVPEGEGIRSKDVVPTPAQYIDPDDPGLLGKKSSGDEGVSFGLLSPELELNAAGEGTFAKTLKYHLYLGPKDRDVFKNNELYKRLKYFLSIDFRACCCPASIIGPLAFGIISLMKGIYNFVPNYGVVIMILVFLIRLLMHPVTKRSQVSMMKMQKLGPKMEEIKKKYANNKSEMNKRVMALYKEQGVSPVASFLPMMLQMPVWIALWTAIYTSIDLRGAGFLPFWITDLSAPDALIRFEAITIPLLGWEIDSFNLLPLLMGVVMYLQQKLMPHSSNAQTNPQVAQQQKMMMIMMPLMFPIMLYKGPSGVNLYIMSSISAGVLEQMVIRKHLREKESEESAGMVAVTSKTGGRVKKKKPKPFFRDH